MDELEGFSEIEPESWKKFNCKEIEEIINGNIYVVDGKFAQIVSVFVTSGYYLRRQLDEKMYEAEGFEKFEDYVKDRYGKSRSWATRMMQINEKFSIGGNDPRIDKNYMGYGISQLQEMLYLGDKQLEEISPDMTVKEIRQKRNPDKRAEVESPCDASHNNSAKNSDVAEASVKNKCEELKDECIELEAMQGDIGDLDFSVRTYNTLKKAGIDTIEELCKMSDEDLTRVRNFSKKCLDEVHQKLQVVVEEDEPVIETGEAELAESVLDNAENESDCTEIVSEDLYEEMDELSDMEIAKEELDKANRMLSDMKKCFTENDKRVRKQKILVAALAAFISDLDDIINPPPEPVLPEIPTLRNNDQRKQFIDNYQEWPVWIETKKTREKYYRCDLSDGMSLVVKTYFHKCFDYFATNEPWESRYHDDWGNKEYYLLEEGKYFKDCLTNKSSLVDYLKEFQKGDK